jgi:hypothetical protein
LALALPATDSKLFVQILDRFAERVSMVSVAERVAVAKDVQRELEAFLGTQRSTIVGSGSTSEHYTDRP